MKHLAIIFCFYTSFIFSQSPFLIEEEFNTGTAPAGWTFTSITSNSTLQNCGKSANCLVFNATNDQVVCLAFANGDQLTFAMICSGTPNATDKMKVEGFNGSWSTLANIKPHTTSVISCVSLSAGITQIRLTYTMGSAGNVYIDDFTVREAGKCTAATGQPYVTGINADACSSGCEGHDEFFTLKNGNAALSASDLEISYPNAGTSPSTWCGSAINPCDKFIATNSSEVASLNSLAGCTIFMSNATIPANADIMLFNGNPQQQRTNFSGLCGSGKTYYALFANNTNTSSSDGCNGRFGNRNTGCSDCYRGLFIRNRASGCSDTVSYDETQINGNDGAMALFASMGSPANYSSSAASTCAFIVLPVKIISFYVQTGPQENTLFWETEAGESVKSYDVEKSDDGAGFYKIGSVTAKTGHDKLSYSYTDSGGQPPVSYYRLKSTDTDGNEVYGQIIYAANVQQNKLVITQDEEAVYIKTNEKDSDVQSISVYNSMGEKLLSESFTGTSYSFAKAYARGQFCYVILDSGSGTVTKRLFVD